MAMPNPFAGFPISDGWAEHRARGSLGGVDFATPVGTRITAPAAGHVSYEYGSGSGGYIITLALADSPGYKIQFLHCSAFEGGNRNVSAGELLGYTGGAAGAAGAGSSTGPHVHVHMIDPNGVREDVMPWFGGTSSATPAASDAQAQIQEMLKAQGLYDGPVDGVFGPKSWRGVQTWLARYSLYGGAIDGIPGPNTYRGMQNYGKKNGNYSGAVDGILGPRSWAGFVQSMKEDTAPAPAPAPQPAKPVTPAPVTPTPAPVTPEPVKPAPVTPKPVTPNPTPVVKPTPSKPTKPVKEPAVPEITPLPETANNAANDALGILIPEAKNRKLAYALYGLASLVISNVAVGVLASGIPAPAWLVISLAVVGNLAAPFATLAIANAGTKK